MTAPRRGSPLLSRLLRCNVFTDGREFVGSRRGSGSVQNPNGSFWLACLFLFRISKNQCAAFFSGVVSAAPAGSAFLFWGVSPATQTRCPVMVGMASVPAKKNE